MATAGGDWRGREGQSSEQRVGARPGALDGPGAGAQRTGEINRNDMFEVGKPPKNRLDVAFLSISSSGVE